MSDQKIAIIGHGSPDFKDIIQHSLRLNPETFDVLKPQPPVLLPYCNRVDYIRTIELHPKPKKPESDIV